jgi:ABC-type proline/glycine betaine transport system ATPase subunit
MAREVKAHHFVIGADPMVFVLFGSAGSGKTAMLYYLNWLVNCNSKMVLLEHFDDPRYYSFPDFYLLINFIY